MGHIQAIFIGVKKGEALSSVEEVRAIPGKGLAGDRYFLPEGTASPKWKAAAEITLIEIEALEALGRESDIILAPINSRRNILTRGVALNHLVGKVFRLGEITLRGIMLCEPCNDLAKMTEKGVLAGLVHRGGLRAQILQEGVIKVGDSIGEVIAQGI